MRLDQITAEIRPRSDWEAVDLGCVLVKTHFRRLMTAWFVCVLPLWALVCGLCYQVPVLAMFLVWWLKPVYDRVPLFYLSRALFGAPPPLKETLKNWPRLLFMWPFQSLFWRRFSPYRSFLLPVVQLEGLRGPQYKVRSQLLGRHGSGAAFHSLTACLAFEMVVVMGFIAFAVMMIPEESLPDVTGILVDLSTMSQAYIPPLFIWVSLVLYLVSISLVEPFYVGAGFGLYLNSRTNLEGWDVELVFRRLAARLDAMRRGQSPPPSPAESPAASSTGGGGVAAALVVALLVGLSALPTTASAQAADPESPAVEAADAPDSPNAETGDVEQTLEKVLSHEDFTIHKVRRFDFADSSSSSSSWDWDLGLGGLGALLFFVAVGLALGGLGYLIWVNRHIFSSRGRLREASPEESRARTVLGMNVESESLPPNFADVAWQLAQQGKYHDALGLLYRGAISWLVERAQLPIAESDTESDCVRHARELPDTAKSDYFAGLTGVWIELAYGKRIPTVEKVEALCKECPFQFQEGQPA